MQPGIGDRTTIRWCVAAALVGVGAGALAAWMGTIGEAAFWFAVLVAAWFVGTLLVLLQRRPSFAFAALQVWMALNVLNGAVMAMVDGSTAIGPYDFTPGLAGGMRIAAIVQLGLVAGMLVTRAAHPARPRVRLAERCDPRLLDRWSIGLLVAGAIALVLYVEVSGAGLGSLDVLSGDNAYGDLKRTADGALVGYLKVLAGLAGVGMMLAVLRLSQPGGGRRRPLVPVIVIGAASLLLISSGGRSWLVVPALASGLLWWKATASAWVRRPRRMLIAGGLGVFALAAIVGGLRGQTGEKVFDTEAFVAKELRGGIFPTTAGLAESVPDQQPYVYGRSFLEAGTLVVPRALWPDKPTSVLKDVQDGFMPLDIGASFGLQGELYANGGLPAVFFGGLLFAGALEWCWLRLTEIGRLSTALWFAAAVPIFIHVFSRGYTITMLAGQLGTVIGVAIAARLVRRHAIPTGMPAPALESQPAS